MNFALLRPRRRQQQQVSPQALMRIVRDGIVRELEPASIQVRRGTCMGPGLTSPSLHQFAAPGESVADGADYAAILGFDANTTDTTGAPNTGQSLFQIRAGDRWYTFGYIEDPA